MKFLRVSIITNKYPNYLEPNALVFVQQLVWTMADQGVKCSVICPLPVNLNTKYFSFPYKKVELTENGSEIEIYSPKYIGFGQSDILGFNPAKITTNNFTKAVSNVINKMKEKPDTVYGHFVTPAGIAAAKIGRKFEIPSFMAHGEATLMTINHYGSNRVSEELATLDGVIAVSTQNKEMLISVNAVRDEIIEVFPNGYREERFYPRDKSQSRKKYGFPEDEFIVAFVGSFDHRKGVKRLMQAVNALDSVYAIFAGKGKLEPSGDKCLYKSVVDNDDLPFFYSAADVFVLPTLNEGCCNAIIEAMACGLPIVSSDCSFNDDILDYSNSIRINPESIEDIIGAISKLQRDQNFLNQLKQGSIKKAKELTLNARASKIIDFMTEQSKKR